MTKKKKFEKEFEFLKLLKANELKSPNEFTIGMGKLIRQAREEKGISQAQLAQAMNRYQATISDIENGKSDISILTLAQFALELQKPLSFFIPTSLLKEQVNEVNTHTEHELVELAKYIGSTDEEELTSEILKALKKFLATQRDMEQHPEDYMQSDDDE